MNKNDLLKCLLNKINDICYISNKYGKEKVNGKKYHTLIDILKELTQKFTIKLKEKVNHKTKICNKIRKHAKNKKMKKKKEEPKKEEKVDTNKEVVDSFKDFLLKDKEDEKKNPSLEIEYTHPSMSDNKIIFGTNSEYANNADNFTQQIELKGQDAIDFELYNNEKTPKHKKMRAFQRLMKSKNLPQVYKQMLIDEKDQQDFDNKLNNNTQNKKFEILQSDNTMIKGNNEIKTTNDFTQIVPKKEKKKKKKMNSDIKEYIEYLKKQKEEEEKKKQNMNKYKDDDLGLQLKKLEDEYQDLLINGIYKYDQWIVDELLEQNYKQQEEIKQKIYSNINNL